MGLAAALALLRVMGAPCPHWPQGPSAADMTLKQRMEAGLEDIVYIGELYMFPKDDPNAIERSYPPYLMSGMANMGLYDMVSLRGHLWSSREFLKGLSREHHLRLFLAPWPPPTKKGSWIPRSDAELEGGTYWDEGRRVAKWDP